MALKVVQDQGGLSLAPQWMSRDLAVPDNVAVAHGVVEVALEAHLGHVTPARVRSSAHFASAAGRRLGRCSLGHPSTGE